MRWAKKIKWENAKVNSLTEKQDLTYHINEWNETNSRWPLFGIRGWWHCHGIRRQIQDNKYLSKWDIDIMIWVSCLETNYFCKSTYLTLTCIEQGVTAETAQYITPVSFYLKCVVSKTSMVFFLITPITSDVTSVDGSSGHLCLWEGPCGGTECRIMTQLIVTCKTGIIFPIPTVSRSQWHLSPLLIYVRYSRQDQQMESRYIS